MTLIVSALMKMVVQLSGGPSSGSNGVSVTEVARVLNDRLSLSQMEVESVQSRKRARLGQGPNLGSQGENTDIEMEVVDAAHHSGGSTTTAASFRNYRLNTPTSQLSSEDGYGSDDADGSVSAQLPALGHHQHDPSTPGLPASISTHVTTLWSQWQGCGRGGNGNWRWHNVDLDQ